MRKIMPFGFLIATLLVSPAVFAIVHNCPAVGGQCHDGCLCNPSGHCEPTNYMSEVTDTGWVSCK